MSLPLAAFWTTAPQVCFGSCWTPLPLSMSRPGTHGAWSLRRMRLMYPRVAQTPATQIVFQLSRP
eukprot:857696-Alexandrium_andersonii.AAC.1